MKKIVKKEPKNKKNKLISNIQIAEITKSESSNTSADMGSKSYIRATKITEYNKQKESNTNEPQTVTTENLVWKKCTEGQHNDATCSGKAKQYTWEAAIKACERLNDGNGYADKKGWHYLQKKN